MINFLGFTDKDFTYLKRDGNLLGDNAWEDNQIDDFCAIDYYAMKSQKKFEFSLQHYIMAEEEIPVNEGDN